MVFYTNLHPYQLDKEKSRFHVIHAGMPTATPREYLNTLDVYNSVLDNKKRGPLLLHKNNRCSFIKAHVMFRYQG